MHNHQREVNVAANHQRCNHVAKGIWMVVMRALKFKQSLFLVLGVCVFIVHTCVEIIRRFLFGTISFILAVEISFTGIWVYFAARLAAGSYTFMRVCAFCYAYTYVYAILIYFLWSIRKNLCTLQARSRSKIPREVNLRIKGGNIFFCE